MPSNTLETTGIVEKIYGNNNYLVSSETDQGKIALPCHMSGRMLKNKINVLPGDTVTLEIPPPYNKGRITFRGVKQSPGESREKQERTKEIKRPKGRGARK